MPSLRTYPAAALLILAGIGAGAARAAETAPTAADAEALARLVRQDCGSCHGMTLKGGLGPDLRARSLTQYDTETLKSVILDGIPETAMPPWRPLLSEAEAEWIARYLLKGDTP